VTLSTMWTTRAAAGRGRLAAVLAVAAAACLGGGAYLMTSPARAQVADAGAVPDAGPVAASASAVPVPAPSAAKGSVGGEAASERAAGHGAAGGATPSSLRGTPAPAPPRVVLAPPARLRVASLRVDAPVVPVAVDSGGALELPEDPAILGGWAGGADPGSGAGTVVLAGHLDTREQGPGVMARVVELPLGARVELAGARGARVAYTVVAVRSYPKSALPSSIFTTTGRERLVLVTCGGTFDPATHHYSDNIVLYAVPARN
jgi:hypothetical protein